MVLDFLPLQKPLFTVETLTNTAGPQFIDKSYKKNSSTFFRQHIMSSFKVSNVSFLIVL